jgi:hypothetical protein
MVIPYVTPFLTHPSLSLLRDEEVILSRTHLIWNEGMHANQPGLNADTPYPPTHENIEEGSRQETRENKEEILEEQYGVDWK